MPKLQEIRRKIRIRIYAWLRHWTDYLHILLGVTGGFLAKPQPLASLTLFITFFLYEMLEEEPLEESYRDLLEFLTGFALGQILYNLSPSM
ncbi:MAG: hypothetical protein DRN15_11060 [Thermoprotei archaeon]|nr:MAG: hypothetical protein DRN15_11060 [Thermoprotei archaeon]